MVDLFQHREGVIDSDSEYEYMKGKEKTLGSTYIILRSFLFITGSQINAGSISAQGRRGYRKRMIHIFRSFYI